MKRTIRVRVADWRFSLGHFGIALFFIGGFVALLFSGMNPWGMILLLGPFLLPMSFWTFMMGLAQIRMNGLEAVCSSDGIGVGRDGDNIWILPWDRYGGYRWIKLSFFDSCLHPERGGYEILDRSGVRVGTLPLDSTSATGRHAVHRLWAIREELEKRVPEGGIRPSPPEPSRLAKVARKKPWQVMTVGCLPSAALFILLLQVLEAFRADEKSGGMIGWLAEGFRVGWVAIPMSAAAIVGMYGLLGLTERKMARQAEQPKPQPLPPEEGPDVREHRLDLLATDGKVVLKEGVRYRYVHPEVLTKILKYEVQQAWATLALGGVLIAIISALSVGAGMLPWGLLVPLALIALLVRWALTYCDSCRQIEASLGDTIVREQGMIVVVKADGEHLSFPMPEFKPVRIFHNSIRVRVLRHGSELYIYDPTHLYEAGPLAAELPLPLVEQP